MDQKINNKRTGNMTPRTTPIPAADARPAVLAVRTGDYSYIWERWAAARRDPDENPDVSAALVRLYRPFTLREGDGPYLWENMIAFFTALWDAVRAIDPSLPPGLPSHLLDPRTAAWFLGMPLEQFNVQATHATARTTENRLANIEQAIEQNSLDLMKVIALTQQKATPIHHQLRLSVLEELVLEKLGGETLRGEVIARRANRTWDGHFKETLVRVQLRGLVAKGPSGYFRLDGGKS